MPRRNRKAAPVDRVKRRLDELAQDHMRQAFNDGLHYTAAVMPQGKTVDYCLWFVEAFQKELERVPTRD